MACRVWLYSKLLPRADRLRNSVHGRIACLQSCEHLPPRPLTGQNDRMHGVLRALRHRSGQRSTNVFVFLWLNPHVALLAIPRGLSPLWDTDQFTGVDIQGIGEPSQHGDACGNSGALNRAEITGA